MYNSNIPSKQELPSTGKLVKSTVIAAVVAVLLLVVVVLPAEYGVDPTGIGNALGLKKMGEIKISLAKELAAETVAMRAKEEAIAAKTKAIEEFVQASKLKAQPATGALNHEMQVTLAPDEGTEIKVDMNKDGKVRYVWWTDGGKANFDLHGDSEELDIDYHSYQKGSAQKSEGILEADFEGSHGWFWRNRTSKIITITLQTNGEYTNIKHLN
ncbi:putative (L31491) ORF2; putative [Plasmid pTOM9] [hydrothermal vent metagenome]|uniref:Putative (L31491) ORF2 putative [Plasmid pTOM9] n=1 Tax=hydrothermal vent metagenome TaxID=652676 RepID=A0A3B0RJZ1_9ZZZZ